MRCVRTYDGLGWVHYDIAYRRRAAKRKDLNWASIDTTLYNMWFTGKSRGPPTCTHCLEGHDTQSCPHGGNPLWQLLATVAHPAPSWQPQQLPVTQPHLPSSQLYQRQTGWIPARQPVSPPQAQVCGLFNAASGPRCSFHPCRFTHACSQCAGSHPRSQCSLSIGNGKRRQAFPSLPAIPKRARP